MTPKIKTSYLHTSIPVSLTFQIKVWLFPNSRGHSRTNFQLVPNLKHLANFYLTELANQPASPAFARPSGSKGKWVEEKTLKTKNHKTATKYPNFVRLLLK